MEKQRSLALNHEAWDRRSFLKLSGLLGLGLTSSAILPAAAEAVKFDRKMYKVSETRAAMGTYVSMTLFHSSKDKAEAAMGHAFEEIGRLTSLLNRFDHRTYVAQLNREGALTDIPKEMAEVVARALDYYLITQGNFDISVKPVVDLFKECHDQGKSIPPEPRVLHRSLRLVGSDKIELKGRTLRFKMPGMGVTLDGIAKGYIVDKASEMLIRSEVKDHLINAGGDIRTSGANPEKKSWTVAIEDPQKKQNFPATIAMKNGAIATSGNYEVYYDSEKMFHHIVDPKTGMSPYAATSVSVISDTAMNADALSTSVFVLKPTSGIDFINRIPKTECLVISRTGYVLKSSGWKSSAI